MSIKEEVEIERLQRIILSQTKLNTKVIGERDNLKTKLAAAERVICLAVDDLRMRADEDGVINISDFIWQKLANYKEDK